MAILELQQQSSSQNENTGRDLLSNSCIALFVTLRTQCALPSQLSSKEIYNTRVNQAMFSLTTINQWHKKMKGIGCFRNLQNHIKRECSGVKGKDPAERHEFLSKNDEYCHFYGKPKWLRNLPRPSKKQKTITATSVAAVWKQTITYSKIYSNPC